MPVEPVVHRPDLLKAGSSAFDRKRRLSKLSVRELRLLAMRKNLRPKGSGSRGRLLKKDLIKVLSRYPL